MNQLSLPFKVTPSLALFNDPLWPTFRQYIRNYPGKHNRFEISSAIPQAVLAAALALTVPCVHCGKKIHPIRMRQAAPGRDTKNTAKQFFIALTCPLTENFGCARGKKARDASRLLADALTP